MANSDKLQADLNAFTADLAAKFTEIRTRLDNLNSTNDPAEQAKIDAIDGQVVAADAAVKAFVVNPAQ